MEPLDRAKMAALGFTGMLDQPDNVYTDSRPPNQQANGPATKGFTMGFGDENEFQELQDRKGGDLLPEGDSDDEPTRRRPKPRGQGGRGR